jgi:uncharacterized transporter YbjL
MAMPFKEFIGNIARETGLVVVIFLAAVGLSYLGDFLEKTHRPEWLIAGAEVVSIILFVMDATFVVSIIGIKLARKVSEIARGQE